MPGQGRERKQQITLPQMGELTTEVHINVAEIPDHVRDDLAAATLDLIRGILRQPGGREALDAITMGRKERAKNGQEGGRNGIGQAD